MPALSFLMHNVCKHVMHFKKNVMVTAFTPAFRFSHKFEALALPLFSFFDQCKRSFANKRGATTFWITCSITFLLYTSRHRASFTDTDLALSYNKKYYFFFPNGTGSRANPYPWDGPIKYFIPQKPLCSYCIGHVFTFEYLYPRSFSSLVVSKQGK